MNSSPFRLNYSDNLPMDVAILHAGGFDLVYSTYRNLPMLFGHVIYEYHIYYPFFRDATTIGLVKVRDTYPFGVDPKWHGTRSELPFLNSLKMKMSILLGVSQMNLGIILSYYNAKYFQNNINIW